MGHVSSQAAKSGCEYLHASHPQLSAARSPEPDPNARAPYLPAPWALRKTREQIALPEPRGGERQSPERIRARDLASLWGTRKARATPGAETFSLCVFLKGLLLREESPLEEGNLHSHDQIYWVSPL